MRRVGLAAFLFVLTGACSNACAQPTQTGCLALQTQLDAQGRAGDFAGADSTLDRIATSGSCSQEQIKVATKRLSGAISRRVATLQDDPRRTQEYRSLLQQEARYGVLWDSPFRLADLQVREKQFREAAQNYQQAIEILSAMLADIPPERRDPALVRVGNHLVKRAEETRHLAASMPQGASSTAFVSADPSHRGSGVGGVYSEEFGRGLEATKVPPPITFKYDSTEMTPIGRQAAAELSEVLRQRHPGRVAVTGHTDQRGSDTYNLDLSRRRAAAIVQFLRANGLSAEFVAIGKGRSEPRALSSESNYSQAEIDALNRRVELDWNG